ncbi:protein kinase [Nonomuraea sp. NPDC050790]|uniref:protein kinase domain-containing protein n=1 Tax=Nonomuraea sp. NPDC050790 TaxID=3364371 RepID=UPI00379025AA
MSVLERVGEYRILGTLGSGGQGVVHLGQGTGGEKVAIKMLHRVSDPQAVARFLREAEVLPEVASFCTAQVLGTGSESGVPYIVSEFIDGPTLQASVRERGPIGGRELRRLAVGTVTALAAIHRAGVVHRDFKPANVLLSREGPRVIDFGIARAASGETTIGGVVGTPAYMAPEQFGQAVAGPPADLFAWAATIVFAATGRAPFGQDSVPAIMHRLANEQPELGGLDGDLREIVAACLVKEPAERPRASQVLLRLLGHPAPGSGGNAGRVTRPVERRQPDAVPEGLLREGQAVSRRPRRLRTALIGGTALAVAAAVTGTILITRPGPFTPSTSRQVPSAAVSAPASSSVSSPASSPALSGPPPGDAVAVSVPQLAATFFEGPRDPIRLTSFTVKEESLRQPGFVRKPGTREFLRLPEYRDAVVSPDGRLVASVYTAPKYASEGNNTVQFTDRALTPVFSVPTVELPLLVRRPAWARDGSRVLLTVTDIDGRATGFAVVDVAARTVGHREVSGLAKAADFAWGPDGTVLVTGGGAVGVYALDGRLLRTVKGVRSADDLTAEVSGRLLVAGCAGRRAVCVVEHESGKRVGRFPLGAKQKLWGWFNQDHLLVYDHGVSPWRVDVVDLAGKKVRPFATMNGDADTFWRLFWAGG